MRSAEEHTGHDRIYATAPGAERVMRRFLADLTSGSHAFLFVAESDGRTVGFISGELRRALRRSAREPGPPWTTSSSSPSTGTAVWAGHS